MTRVASSAEGAKKTTKVGKRHTERERITEKEERKDFKRGKKKSWRRGRVCDGKNKRFESETYLKTRAEWKQTYMERCLCSDFWKRSEVIWHTAWSSPASSCTVAGRKQTQT